MPPLLTAPVFALSRRDPLARLGVVVLLALVAAAATIYGLILVQAASSHQDLDTYLSAARDLAQGRPLYQAFLHHPFPDPTLRPAYIYPPAFVPAALALSALPTPAQGWAWLIAMQIALAVAFLLVLRAVRPSLSGGLLAAAATLTFYPLWVDALQGQANALILALAVIGVVLVARGRDGGALLPILPLLSSVTWEHHLILLLPLVWMVIFELARRGWPPAECGAMIALMAGFDVLARWHPGPAPLSSFFRAAQTADPLVLLSANSLVLATLALFLLSPWLLRTR